MKRKDFLTPKSVLLLVTSLVWVRFQTVWVTTQRHLTSKVGLHRPHGRVWPDLVQAKKLNLHDKHDSPSKLYFRGVLGVCQDLKNVPSNFPQAPGGGLSRHPKSAQSPPLRWPPLTRHGWLLVVISLRGTNRLCSESTRMGTVSELQQDTKEMEVQQMSWN